MDMFHSLSDSRKEDEEKELIKMYDKYQDEEKVVNELQLRKGYEELIDGDLKVSLINLSLEVRDSGIAYIWASDEERILCEMKFTYKNKESHKKVMKISYKAEKEKDYGGKFDIAFPLVKEGDRKKIRKMIKEGVRQMNYTFYILEHSMDDNTIDVRVTTQKVETGTFMFK